MKVKYKCFLTCISLSMSFFIDCMRRAPCFDVTEQASPHISAQLLHVIHGTLYQTLRGARETGSHVEDNSDWSKGDGEKMKLDEDGLKR